MRLTGLKKGLLIIALALSQWLVAAHSLQHSALVQDQACQICLHAQGLDSGAVPLVLPAIALPQQSEIPVGLPSTLQLRTAHTSYPIRGPPDLLS